MKQILIVEDDIKLNHGLCRALGGEDLHMVPCTDLKSAREQLALFDPSLILLDINLPDGSGIDLLKECKASRKDVPVILLTANDTDMDIVQGLDQGADDYITKPFSLSVLRARVRAQLRRAERASEKIEGQVFVQGAYRFDFCRMIFTAKGEPVELSRTEQRLLRILTDNSGITVSRAQLMDRVWTDGADYVDENALSVAVKRLRDKLDARNEIKTVYGLGYRWENGDD